jgi:ATP-dependent protease ClpP protease subunit
VTKDPRYDKIFAEFNLNQLAAHTDQQRRRRVLKNIESLDSSVQRRVAVYYMRLDRDIARGDILPFTNMLKSIGSVDCLDLIVVSPGGDGTVAETLLDLLRKYCSCTLRIVVPLYAKSAATLMALGADEIVMGETSELGPIDAQIGIVEGNENQQVSADHFLRARNDAVSNLASTEAHIVRAAEIQIASLNPAFLTYCQDSMDFGRKFAAQQLRDHMFHDECVADKVMWETRIDEIVSNLTSSSDYLTHGRMISAKDIAKSGTLCHLKVKDLDKDDAYWKLVSELLTRTEIVAHTGDIGKMLYARNFEMIGG